MQDVRARFGLARLQNDAVALDAPHSAKPDDVLDLSQGLKLAGAEHRAAVHRRRARGVDPHEPTRRLEPFEQVVDVRRLGACLGIERDPLDDRSDLLQRLKVAAVMEPRVAWTDPANPVRLDAVIQQPDARVRSRLA